MAVPKSYPPFSGYSGTGGGGGGGGAPVNAQYLVLALDGTLTDERVFTPSVNFLVVDGGPGGTYTFDLSNTTVAAGSYTYASITVDAKGRLTSASSGVAPVTAVNVDAGELTTTGGTTPTLGLANAGTAGTYAYPSSLTTDAFGRVTAVTAGVAPVASGWTDGGTVVYLDTTTDVVSIGSNTPVTNRKLSIINTGTNLGIAVTPLAAADNLLESKLAADANPIFRSNSAGTLEWGPGGTAPEIRLRRDALYDFRFDSALTAVATNWGFSGTLSTSSRRRATAAIAVSTNIAATASQFDVLLVDPTAGPVTITIVGPSATTRGRTYTIKRTTTSANTVTIQPASGNIDNAASYVLAGGTLASVDVVCDATNWWVI